MFDAMDDPRTRAVAAQRYPQVAAAYEKDPKDFGAFLVFVGSDIFAFIGLD